MGGNADRDDEALAAAFHGQRATEVLNGYRLAAARIAGLIVATREDRPQLRDERADAERFSFAVELGVGCQVFAGDHFRQDGA